MPAPRLDRLATLCLAPVFRESAAAIPVLMYHSVADDDHSSHHPYYQTTTTLKAFESQVRFLRDNGYQTLSLSEAFQRLGAGDRGQKYAVITFDDGFENFYSNAFPILKKYGATATMYLPTDFIGDTTLDFKGLPCMTWQQVRELMAEGITFGSHSVTHRRLDGLNRTELNYEIQVSKETMEQKLGEAVDSFAYPFAFPEADAAFTNMFKELLMQNGYRFGVTTIIGLTSQRSDKLLVRRLPVNTWDDARFFDAKLRGAYNWLHAFQYASKLLRTGVQGKGVSHAS